MRIIHAHMHLGESAPETLRTSFCGPWRTREAHLRIRRFADEYPGPFCGLACLNPLFGERVYRERVGWALGALKSKDIKVHPGAFCVAPTHPAAEKVYRLADELSADAAEGILACVRPLRAELHGCSSPKRRHNGRDAGDHHRGTNGRSDPYRAAARTRRAVARSGATGDRPASAQATAKRPSPLQRPAAAATIRRWEKKPS